MMAGICFTFNASRKFLWLLLCLQWGVTQSTLAQGDTLKPNTLSEAGFLAILRNYHPIVRQAEYAIMQADARLTTARGSFDPLLNSQTNRKRLAGDLYYNYFKSELVIPTWYGIEIYAGLENIYGNRVNIENTLEITSYLGVSVPLLRDLVMDKRRAALRQAKLFVGQSQAERDLVVNDLLFEALGTYWNWVREYRVYTVISQAVKANEERFKYVRAEYLLGNRPAIDTVESLAQLQQFQYLQNEAYLKFQNAGIDLSAFLWKDNEAPYQLPVAVIPDSAKGPLPDVEPIPPLEDILTLAQREHPKLRTFNYKLDMLEIEQKLKWQGLLPRVDLKANLLNKGYNALSGLKGNFLENNYKFGIDLSVPLRFSEGRGGYREMKLKRAVVKLDFNLQQQQVDIKVKSYYNEVLAVQQQLRIMEDARQNYQRLSDAEMLRFRFGESSLFQVNLRELKTYEAIQKVEELKVKYRKNRLGLVWASGQLR